MENIAAIISALGTIIAAWFAYNQYTKNKLTDLKLDNWKKEEEQKSAKRSDSIAKIYGVLWQLLHYLQADRVYIIQPHPLTNSLFLSISLEVKRNGIADMKSSMQHMPMSDIAAFTSELSHRDLLFYKEIDEEVKDKRARAMLSSNGSESAIIKKLSNDEYGWVGSICCEFMRTTDIKPDYARKELSDAADKIQYILPDYK